MPPQFLVVGHTVQDLASDRAGDGPGWRLGGAASYASLLARRLGLRTAVLTAAAADMPLEDALPGVEIVRVPSPRSTQIRNVYTDRGRVQHIPQRAPRIDPASLPADWRKAEIVLLAPVVGEVGEGFAGRFPEALIGVSAQGWLRDLDSEGRVRPLAPSSWRAEPVLRPAHMLIVSDEDVPAAHARPALDEWSRQVDVLVYTHAERGADVCHRGVWRHIDAFPASEVDPTGAGDAFAAAFLVRYREAADPWRAVRFAACAASFTVETVGPSHAPDREMIEVRLRAHPEIICRPV